MACWMNLPFYVKAYTEVVLTENSCFCFLERLLLALLDSNGVICFEAIYIMADSIIWLWYFVNK